MTWVTTKSRVETAAQRAICGGLDSRLRRNDETRMSWSTNPPWAGVPPAQRPTESRFLGGSGFQPPNCMLEACTRMRHGDPPAFPTFHEKLRHIPHTGRKASSSHGLRVLTPIELQSYC
jgi:hypothetical protein